MTVLNVDNVPVVVITGGGTEVTVPDTATFTFDALPPLLMIFPAYGGLGEFTANPAFKRVNMVVLANAPPVYATVTLSVNSFATPVLDTSKFVGAVTVISPALGVKTEPESVYEPAVEGPFPST